MLEDVPKRNLVVNWYVAAFSSVEDYNFLYW